MDTNTTVERDLLKPWKRGIPEANRRKFQPQKPPTIKTGPYTGLFVFRDGRWQRVYNG